MSQSIDTRLTLVVIPALLPKGMAIEDLGAQLAKYLEEELPFWLQDRKSTWADARVRRHVLWGVRRAVERITREDSRLPVALIYATFQGISVDYSTVGRPGAVVHHMSWLISVDAW